MQALMLAAGMGKRLGRYTEAQTKCMVEVGGRPLLDRAVEAVKQAGIQKFVIVVGWEGDRLVRYIQSHFSDITFEFIYNHDYAETNNIYSLYMARDYLARDDTLLLESDLIYDLGLLRKIVQHPEANLVTVAKYEEWMEGTVVTLTADGKILDFIEKDDFLYQKAEEYYKTVNIYKFSREFSRQQYIPFLEAYITAYGRNQYYEIVLKTLAHLSQSQLKAFILENVPWYEIDTAQDLDIANTLFAPDSQKLIAYETHYGGYWRFPGIKDFCYLVNPYFPPQKLLEKMTRSYGSLLTQYPSGMDVQRMLAGRMFRLKEERLLVGNGAAELICALGHVLHGSLAVPVPTFNEYLRAFTQCEFQLIPTLEYDLRLDKERLLQAARTTDILAIVNPDNPSGSFLSFWELKEILECCEQAGTRCIVDESFVDFAQKEKRYTLLQDELLDRYPHLIVIKSISKSYGVPGLRLGVLASADDALIQQIRAAMPIWNINSFAEYFLQVFSSCAAEYLCSCDRIAEERQLMELCLKELDFLEVYPSQANFIMCRVKPPYHSRELATQLLINHQILVKDLSGKKGLNGGEYIRVAVKSREENSLLCESLQYLNI